MNLDKNQLAGDPIKIGLLHGKPVFQVVTKGGFYMDIVAKDGSFKTLGTGSHHYLARHIAEKNEPSIKWTDLKKGDFVPFEDIAFLVPKYEAITNRIRALE